MTRTAQLQAAFCGFTSRPSDHTHQGAVEHLCVWNHLSWLFLNELRHS